MKQASLFGPTGPSRWADTDAPAAAPAPTEHQEQEAQADRVGKRIDAALVAFCRAHVGREVRMADLTAAVAKAVEGHVAPDSPGRRFRALRADGTIQARNTDRGQSLYRIDGVREAT
jgi:hypothetical protein